MNELELSILNWMQNTLRTPFGDAVMAGITHLGDKGAVWVLLAAALLMHGKTRRQGAAVAAALLFSLLACNLTLKPLAARIRPYDINTAVQLLVAKPRDFSFPSGHTAASFAAVGALYFSRWRCWWAAAVLAALIAFSRLYLYVHFPTDVIAGAVLGILLGGAGALLVGSYPKSQRT